MPLSPDKLPAALALTQRLERFVVCIDHRDQLAPLLRFAEAQAAAAAVAASAALANGTSEVSPLRRWHIALLVDCGYHREGLDPFDAAGKAELVHLARQVQKSSRRCSCRLCDQAHRVHATSQPKHLDLGPVVSSGRACASLAV